MGLLRFRVRSPQLSAGRVIVFQERRKAKLGLFLSIRLPMCSLRYFPALAAVTRLSRSSYSIFTYRPTPDTIYLFSRAGHL